MAKTSGQIIERGRDRWLVKVYVGRDVNGKRKYISKTVHGGKKEAEDKHQEGHDFHWTVQVEAFQVEEESGNPDITAHRDVW